MSEREILSASVSRASFPRDQERAAEPFIASFQQACSITSTVFYWSKQTQVHPDAGEGSVKSETVEGLRYYPPVIQMSRRRSLSIGPLSASSRLRPTAPKLACAKLPCLQSSCFKYSPRKHILDILKLTTLHTPWKCTQNLLARKKLNPGARMTASGGSPSEFWGPKTPSLVCC